MTTVLRMSTPPTNETYPIAQKISEVAAIEAAKSFRIRGGHEKHKGGLAEDGRINRQTETRRFIEARLHALDRAIGRQETVLFATHHMSVYAKLGSGIRDFIILPEGSPDPDYPVADETRSRGHGGILASPHVDVVIDTVGPLEVEWRNPDRAVLGPISALHVPLYTALEFIETGGSSISAAQPLLVGVR